jgi:tetratricopeptide (TPR) repeat protein
LAEAERLDPREPRWPYLQGLTFLQTSPDEGIACLHRALARCPDDRGRIVRLRLIEALLDAGRLDEAGSELQKVLAAEPDNRRARFEQGQLAVLRQDWTSAVAALSACVNDEHVRRRARLLRAQAYRELGDRRRSDADTQSAREAAEEVRWPDPFAEEVLRLQRGYAARLQQADALCRAGRPEQAFGLLEDTARKYPASADPWVRMAELWHDAGENERAEQACRQALAADPQSAQAWFRLGCFQAARRPQEAAKSFREAIRLRPDHTLAHYNLAYCLKQLGDRSGAASEYRQALRCQPDYEPARQALQALTADGKGKQ